MAKPTGCGESLQQPRRLDEGEPPELEGQATTLPPEHPPDTRTLHRPFGEPSLPANFVISAAIGNWVFRHCRRRFSLVSAKWPAASGDVADPALMVGMTWIHCWSNGLSERRSSAIPRPAVSLLVSCTAWARCMAVFIPSIFSQATGDG